MFANQSSNWLQEYAIDLRYSNDNEYEEYFVPKQEIITHLRNQFILCSAFGYSEVCLLQIKAMHIWINEV